MCWRKYLLFEEIFVVEPERVVVDLEKAAPAIVYIIDATSGLAFYNLTFLFLFDMCSTS